MKTGMFRLPHTTLRRPALVWTNGKDADFSEAISMLSSNMQGIKQLVIVTEQCKANYATKQLISWFMGQRFDRNVKFSSKLRTHKMKNNAGELIEVTNATTSVTRKPKSRRNYVDQLIIKINFINARNQPKDYYRMYVLTPQMHIFPSDYTDARATNLSFLMVDSWGVGQASASSEYDYYKMVMSQVQNEWTPSRPIKPKRDYDFHDFPLYQALCDAYELDSYDEHAVEQLDWYIMHKEQIVRTPQDEDVYYFFSKLGIAPAFSTIVYKTINGRLCTIADGISVYDPDNFTSIGKEGIMDDMREFTPRDLLPGLY